MAAGRTATHFLVALAAILLLSSQFRASSPELSRDAKWATASIRLAVSNSVGSAQNIRGNPIPVIGKSLALWSAAADVEILYYQSDLVAISPKGKGDGVSLLTMARTPEDISLFPREASSPAAFTRVFFNAKGQITEADILLNPFASFSTDNTFDTYDLQDVVTHEIGHLLGLRHSSLWGSVMFASLAKNVGHLPARAFDRRLPATDAASLKALYGPRPSDVIDCCGSLDLRISGGEGASRIQAWIEEIGTGRVVAASEASRGLARIGGIPAGTYTLRTFASFPGGSFSDQESSVSITPHETASTSIRLPEKANGVSVKMLGVSFLIGRSALRIGDTDQHILLAVDAGAEEITHVGIAGSDLWFSSTSLSGTFQSRSVKVIQASLAPLSGLGRGEYTLLIENSRGTRTYLPASIVVY